MADRKTIKLKRDDYFDHFDFKLNNDYVDDVRDQLEAKFGLKCEADLNGWIIGPDDRSMMYFKIDSRTIKSMPDSVSNYTEFFSKKLIITNKPYLKSVIRLILHNHSELPFIDKILYSFYEWNSSIVALHTTKRVTRNNNNIKIALNAEFIDVFAVKAESDCNTSFYIKNTFNKGDIYPVKEWRVQNEW